MAIGNFLYAGLIQTAASADDAASASGLAPEAMVDQSQKFISGMRDKILGLGDFFKDKKVDIVWAAITVLLIMIVSKLVLMLVSWGTGRAIQRSRNAPPGKENRRLESVLSLLRSASRYVIYMVEIILILYAIGLGKAIGLVMAGAGIGALAIGFGAQSLVKDVVSGFFLMFENQYAVGDFVRFEELKIEGTIEATALRVTYVRALNGNQIIVPNGTIQTVINKSTGYNQAQIDIASSYENDTRSVLKVIQRVLDRFEEEYGETHLTDSPTLLGVVNLADSAVIIRIVCNCIEMKHWEVERIIRLSIKEAFESAGLGFPYPHLTIAQQEGKSNPPPVEKGEMYANQKRADNYYRSPWQSGEINLGEEQDD